MVHTCCSVQEFITEARSLIRIHSSSSRCVTLIQGLFQTAVDVKAYFDRRTTSWTRDKLDNKPRWSVSRKSLCFKTNQRPKNSVSRVAIYFSFLYLFTSIYFFFISAKTHLSQNVTAIKVYSHSVLHRAFFWWKNCCCLPLESALLLQDI